MTRGRKPTDPEQRFLALVSPEPMTGCWLWLGAINADGYGVQFKIGSRTDGSRRGVIPHRWAYQHWRGDPGDLVIDHLCRVRCCVNPWHLQPVTSAENTKRGARATATHCKSGHPLSDGNVRMNLSNGQWRRACKTCGQRWAREHGTRTGWEAQRRYKERRRQGEHHRLG